MIYCTSLFFSFYKVFMHVRLAPHLQVTSLVHILHSVSHLKHNCVLWWLHRLSIQLFLGGWFGSALILWSCFSYLTYMCYKNQCFYVNKLWQQWECCWVSILCGFAVWSNYFTQLVVLFPCQFHLSQLLMQSHPEEFVMVLWGCCLH